MKKQDLKDGMILETRYGERYLFINGKMFDFNGYMRLSDYSDDLKFDDDKDYDIIKVYKDVMADSLTTIFKDEYLTLIWERKETKLTDREVEVLKALKTVGFHWIARDRHGGLFTYENKPEKLTKSSWWGDNYCFPIKKERKLFNFIKWADAEPTKIDDLLKGV